MDGQVEGHAKVPFLRITRWLLHVDVLAYIKKQKKKTLQRADVGELASRTSLCVLAGTS